MQSEKSRGASEESCKAGCLYSVHLLVSVSLRSRISFSGGWRAQKVLSLLLVAARLVGARLGDFLRDNMTHTLASGDSVCRYQTKGPILQSKVFLVQPSRSLPLFLGLLRKFAMSASNFKVGSSHPGCQNRVFIGRFWMIGVLFAVHFSHGPTLVQLRLQVTQLFFYRPKSYLKQCVNFRWKCLLAGTGDHSK